MSKNHYGGGGGDDGRGNRRSIGSARKQRTNGKRRHRKFDTNRRKEAARERRGVKEAAKLEGFVACKAYLRPNQSSTENKAEKAAKRKPLSHFGFSNELD